MILEHISSKKLNNSGCYYSICSDLYIIKIIKLLFYKIMMDATSTEDEINIKHIIDHRVTDSDTVFLSPSKVIEYLHINTSQFRDNVMNDLERKKQTSSFPRKVMMEDLDEDDHYEAVKLDNAMLNMFRTIRRNIVLNIDSTKPLEWGDTKITRSLCRSEQSFSHDSDLHNSEPRPETSKLSKSNNFYHLGFYHYIANCIQLEMCVVLDPFVIRSHILEIVEYMVRQKRHRYVHHLTNNDVLSKNNLILEVDHMFDDDMASNKILKLLTKESNTLLEKYPSILASLAQFDRSLVDKNKYDVKTIISGSVSEWEDLKTQITNILEPLRGLFGSYPVLDLTKMLMEWINNIRIMNQPINYQAGSSHYKIGGKLFVELRQCFNKIRSYFIDDCGTIDTKAIVIFSSSECEFDNDKVGTFTNAGIWHTKIQHDDGAYVLKLVSVDTFETSLCVPMMTEKLKISVETIINFIDEIFNYFCNLETEKMSHTLDAIYPRNIWNSHCLKTSDCYYLNYDGWRDCVDYQKKSKLDEKFANFLDSKDDDELSAMSTNNKYLNLVRHIIGSESDVLICMSLYTFNPKLIYLAVCATNDIVFSSNETYDNEQKMHNVIKYISYIIVHMIAHIDSLEPSAEDMVLINIAKKEQNNFVHECVCDTDCLICFKSLTIDKSMKIFGETSFRVSFGVIIEIIYELMHLVAKHLNLHIVKVVRLIMSHIYEEIKTEFRNYTSNEHSKSHTGNQYNKKSQEPKIMRILKMTKISKIPTNMALMMKTLCFVKKWVVDPSDLFSNKKKIVHDIDKIMMTDHLDIVHILELLYINKNKGIHIIRCTNDKQCNIAYMKSEHSVLISDQMIDQLTEITNYLLPITDTQKDKFIEKLHLRESRHDVIKILNIISNHYVLIKIMNLEQKFWNDIIFYTFNFALYTVYLNKYHNDLDESLPDKAIRPTRKELLIKLLNRIDSMIKTQSSDSSVSDISDDHDDQKIMCCKDYKIEHHKLAVKNKAMHDDGYNHDNHNSHDYNRWNFFDTRVGIDESILKKPMILLINNYRSELSCTDFNSHRIKKILAESMKPKNKIEHININRFA